MEKARRFWPDQDPIGKRLVLTFYSESPREVVGIVGDVKQQGLAVLQPSPTIYVPLAQMSRPWMSVVVRTTSPPAALIPAVTGAIREIDAEQPVLDVMTLGSLLDDSLAHQRFSMLLLALFAGFALLLAGMLFGVPPTDPLTFTVVSALHCAIALLACPSITAAGRRRRRGSSRSGTPRSSARCGPRCSLARAR